MNTNIFKYILVTFVVITLFAFEIVAQESVAKINKIASVKNGKLEGTLDETSSAQLQRIDQKKWKNVKKNDELYFNDNLKLNQKIRLRVKIKNKHQDGTISFAPHDLTESGLYEIKEAQDGSKRVAIEIKQGSAVFTVAKDKINTTTKGLQSVVQSGSITRALYHVNSDSSGEIYLQQGRLFFPGNNQADGLKEGEAAYFRDGQITKVFIPDLQLATEYQNYIKINSSTIWKKPFWKRPTTWIGAAAVGVGTALIIIKPWESGNNQVSGTININWGN